jgi:hypothetical protein
LCAHTNLLTNYEILVLRYVLSLYPSEHCVRPKSTSVQNIASLNPRYSGVCGSKSKLSQRMKIGRPDRVPGFDLVARDPLNSLILTVKLFAFVLVPYNNQDYFSSVIVGITTS